MRATWGFALSLFAFATTAIAQADLQVISSASPTTGLSVGQDVLVATTMRNNGPNAATNPIGILSLAQQESFWFQFISSETLGCVIQQNAVDPPAFVLSWGYPTLAAGQEKTCVARLRVQLVPPSSTTNLFAAVDSDSPDNVGGNNLTSTTFVFGAFVSTSRHAIPSASIWGLALLAIGALAIAFYGWNRGRA